VDELLDVIKSAESQRLESEEKCVELESSVHATLARSTRLEEERGQLEEDKRLLEDETAKWRDQVTGLTTSLTQEFNELKEFQENRELELREEVAELKEKTSTLQKQASETHEKHREMEEAHAGMKKSLEEEKAITVYLRARVATLLKDLSKSHSETDMLAEANASLQEQIDDLNTRLVSFNGVDERLAQSTERAQQAEDSKQKIEMELREQMEKALEDLRRVTMQRNQAALTMNEAVSLSAQHLEEKQRLETKCSEQHDTIEALGERLRSLGEYSTQKEFHLRNELTRVQVEAILVWVYAWWEGGVDIGWAGKHICCR
jgi:chromosome segregation ATPase